MHSTLQRRPTRGRNCTGSRTEPKPQLTDEQWLLIADLFAHEAPSKLGGAAPATTSSLPGRDLVGLTQRGSMERFTNALSFPEHLLAAASRLGRLGHLPESVGTPSGKT